MLTKKQKQVLDFIMRYNEANGFSPSLEEIKVNFRLASASTAHHHVSKLRDAGYINKDAHQARGLAPMSEVEYIEVSILGLIAAGRPIEVLEATNPEKILIPKNDVLKSGRHYALRVQGSSMIDEGIFDGDIVVIREQKVADNGQTVVAIVDENEATLKKFYRERDRIRLQPANPTLFPIYRTEVEIRGIVVKVIRTLDQPTTHEVSQDKKYIRRIDYSWDYRNELTKTYTHGLHSYPAMFIPQVARRLLESYSVEGDTVCDIFCGSGTALVESRLLRRNAYGIDLNPFAIFLARVKTTEIAPKQLTSAYFELLERIEKIDAKSVKSPDFTNLTFWFKEDVIIQLARVKQAIIAIKDEGIRNFFMVAFSSTVRVASNTKNGEFKLVRIQPDKLERHNPNVISLFRKKAEYNIACMIDYYSDVKKGAWTKPIYGDSSQGNSINDESIDCIITSPPYGDSRTTVAYGQFSRLSAQWIDIFENPNDASKLDNELLGGKTVNSIEHSLASSALSESLEKIALKDEKRAKEVLSFNLGLNKCLQSAYKMLKPNKYFCLVIGNRQVKQVRIPTDFIIAELGENIGFVCEDIIVRNIPGKRMPLKNSPTNVAGELEETMNRESIVVLRKS